MTVHILGSSKRTTPDGAFIYSCPWLFDEDPQRFPYGGAYNPSPIAQSSYLVGMPQPFCMGTSAGPFFRRLDFLVSPENDDVWPPSTQVNIVSVLQPKNSAIPWQEYIPIWTPTRAQFIALGGTGDLGISEDIVINIFNRGYCGGTHAAPNHADHTIHDNGDFATSALYWTGSEIADRNVEVTVTLDGNPTGKGDFFVSLGWGLSDWNAALYWDPNNNAEATDKDGKVYFQNILRAQNIGVAAYNSDYSIYGYDGSLDLTLADGVVTLALTTGA